MRKVKIDQPILLTLKNHGEKFSLISCDLSGVAVIQDFAGKKWRYAGENAALRSSEFCKILLLESLTNEFDLKIISLFQKYFEHFERINDNFKVLVLKSMHRNNLSPQDTYRERLESSGIRLEIDLNEYYLSYQSVQEFKAQKRQKLAGQTLSPTEVPVGQSDKDKLSWEEEREIYFEMLRAKYPNGGLRAAVSSRGFEGSSSEDRLDPEEFERIRGLT